MACELGIRPHLTPFVHLTPFEEQAGLVCIATRLGLIPLHTKQTNVPVCAVLCFTL
jgi:hypothetical protein